MTPPAGASWNVDLQSLESVGVLNIRLGLQGFSAAGQTTRPSEVDPHALLAPDTDTLRRNITAGRRLLLLSFAFLAAFCGLPRLSAERIWSASRLFAKVRTLEDPHATGSQQ